MIDGDTVYVGAEAVRLHGIDALEARQTCDRGGEVWQCGNEAKELLASLVGGKSLSCQQRDRDAYGRIVASCRAGDLDLARAMIEGGYAVALPQFSTVYVDAEARMRASRVGMWATEFETPAVFRAANPHLERRPKPHVVKRDRPIALPSTLMQTSPPIAAAYFRNCAAARAAGAAPLYRGQPGYRPPLDADGDGVACEPYRGR